MQDIQDVTQQNRIEYTGDARELASIVVRVWLLIIVTLGIYLPFAALRMRRYIWSHIRIDGKALVFDGDVKSQIDINSVASVTSAALFLLSTGLDIALSIVNAIGSPAKKITNDLSRIGICAAPFAAYGGSQYRLYHTQLMGERFVLGGSTFQYAGIYFKRLILAVLTLGYLYPQFAIQTRRYAMANLRWGAHAITYTGDEPSAAPIYRRGWALSVLTIGVYAPWFSANLYNYHFNRIAIGETRLRSNQTGEGLLALWTGNFFIVILTLGLGAGWAMTRSLRYHTQTLHIIGDLSASPALIEAPEPQTGLADLLGLDRWIV